MFAMLVNHHKYQPINMFSGSTLATYTIFAWLKGRFDAGRYHYPYNKTGWWFQRFFIFTPIWGRFPF